MLICVTNRKLCQGDFLHRVELLAKARPFAVILREKDLDLPAYEQLARSVKAICENNGVRLILNPNSVVAERLQHDHLHLSLSALRGYQKREHPRIIGASVHTIAEAMEAQTLGADYLIAGHIYATDCKKGIPPRGTVFLQQVCQAVSLPVFAIGGITVDKVQEVVASGAKGCCVMSEAMTCDNPIALVQAFTNETRGFW